MWKHRRYRVVREFLLTKRPEGPSRQPTYRRRGAQVSRNIGATGSESPLADGEFLLVGRRRGKQLNSWLHDIPTLQTGAPRILVNPGDAERVGFMSSPVQAKPTKDQGEMQVQVEI